MTNVVLITSDQHNPFVTGFAGDPLVRTPTLDGLAAAGTTFSAAYTNNPICMPARASLATGRYGSTIGCYDNGSPYHDRHAISFGHRLREAGQVAVTFGKLHFDPDADTGFDAHLPLQAKKGYLGAAQGWARGSGRPSTIMLDQARDAQVGPSEYLLYDEYTTRAACRWLIDAAPRDVGWVAHVSYANPHYPYRAPHDRRPPDGVEVPLPPAWQRSAWPRHPELDAHRRLMGGDEHPLDEDELRQLRWIYSGMVEFVDDQIAQVLAALRSSGQADDTVVIYTTDHGDMLGSHGFVMKSLMYDASARLPMVISGPNIDADRTCTTAVSLVDVFPTVVDALGLDQAAGDETLPGSSLIDTASGSDDGDRVVFSEYHGPSSTAASYLVRRGDWKYVRHELEGAPAQLFNVVADPDELDDQAGNPEHAAVLAWLDAALCEIIDPVATDQRIRAEQAELLKAFQAQSGSRTSAPERTALGTLAKGWSVPSAEIMQCVNAEA